MDLILHYGIEFLWIINELKKSKGEIIVKVETGMKIDYLMFERQREAKVSQRTRTHNS